MCQTGTFDLLKCYVLVLNVHNANLHLFAHISILVFCFVFLFCFSEGSEMEWVRQTSLLWKICSPLSDTLCKFKQFVWFHFTFCKKELHLYPCFCFYFVCRLAYFRCQVLLLCAKHILIDLSQCSAYGCWEIWKWFSVSLLCRGSVWVTGWNASYVCNIKYL